MKRLFLSVLCALALDAQSISITHPASGAAVSGYAGYEFQVSLTAAPSVTQVCYTVDTYAAYNPGINAPDALGCSLKPPFSYPYNSYWNANGSHELVATAYNSLNAVVATSAAVPFTTANTWPVACTDGSAPAWSVSPSTAVTSNWAAIVTLTATVTGSCSTDSKTFTVFVDGVSQGDVGGTAASQTFSLYTTQFLNGTHYVCERFDDSTNQSVISGLDITAAGDWCAAVYLNNGSTETNQALLASDKIYLTPGGSSGGNCLTAANGSGSCTETAAILRADGSTTTGTPVFAIQSNTTAFTTPATVASVNQSTGVVTGLANGMANIMGMVPNFTGSVLEAIPTPCFQVKTTSGPALTPEMTGWLLYISSGTGWTPGTYIMANVTSAGIASLTNMSNVNTCPAAGGTGGGVFSTGPTRKGQVFVWSGGNTMPCLGTDGARYTTYNTSCFVVQEMFLGTALLNSDPPLPQGMSMAAYIASGGVNTFEISALCGSFTSGICAEQNLTGTENPSGQSAWNTAQINYAAYWNNLISGYPKLGFWLTGAGYANDSANLYGATSGPAGQWTIPATELAWAAWSAAQNVRGNSGPDEVVPSHWGSHPLQGPLTLGASAQSWLDHITASSGTCAVSNGGGIPIALNPPFSNFLITNSAISGLNSVYPNYYTATSITTTGFNFSCPGVANGTYGTGGTADTAQLQVNADGWTVNTSNGYAPINGFATLTTQLAASGATFGLSWPPAGDTYCQPQWWGNPLFPGAQSISGVNQIAQLGDVYVADGTHNYLIQRLSANAIVNAQLDLGWTLRVMYGCYNPQIPLMIETTAIGVGAGGYGYGLTGYEVPVASTSGNTITFSSPHGITNFIPGMTRISIEGATNSGSAVDSTNSVINTATPTETTAFYLLNCPTPTTCNVAMSVPDFSVTYTGGTATFSNGATAALSSTAGEVFTALDSQTCTHGLCGSTLFTVAAQTRNYGYTFTVSGGSGTVTTNSNCLIPADCNLSRTLQMLIENPNPLSNGFGGSRQFWREIPILSATGGTATIVTDDNYVKGRNYTPAYSDTDPDWAAGDEFEAQILRANGTRKYSFYPAASGYSTALGFTGALALAQLLTFADTTLGNQMYIDPYFENSQGVPIFHAHSIVDLAWERWNSLCSGEVRKNSLDLGGAETGSFFDVGSTNDCLMVFNASDAPQTVTIPTSVQLKGGQPFIQQIVTGHSIGAITTVAAGTTSVTITIPAVGGAFLVFPPDFATELLQPSITPEISGITNAASAVIVYSYDPYYLDVGGNTFNCGTAAVCQPPWDRTFGTIYYRLEYLNSGGVRIAQSAVQTL